MSKVKILFELGSVSTGAGIVVKSRQRNGLEKNPKGYADLTKTTKSEVIIPEEIQGMTPKQKDSYLVRKTIELTLRISKEDGVRRRCKKKQKELHDWLTENVPQYKDMLKFTEMRKLSLKNENRMREIRNEIVTDAKSEGIDLKENRLLKEYNSEEG